MDMLDRPSRKLIILIRHGQAWENLNPYGNDLCEFQLNNQTIPNFDSPLTPLGKGVIFCACDSYDDINV